MTDYYSLAHTKRECKYHGCGIEIAQEKAVWIQGLGRQLLELSDIHASVRWTRALTEQGIKRIGAQAGGRTLFFGGLFLWNCRSCNLHGVGWNLPIEPGPMLIGLFMIAVAVPVPVSSLKEVLATSKQPVSGP